MLLVSLRWIEQDTAFTILKRPILQQYPIIYLLLLISFWNIYSTYLYIYNSLYIYKYIHIYIYKQHIFTYIYNCYLRKTHNKYTTPALANLKQQIKGGWLM